MMQRHHMTNQGFTLIELIVAVSVMSMLLLLISQLFDSTRQAVSVGIKTGEVLVQTEAIREQLERDAAEMLGPNSAGPGGFLIIVQKTVNRRDNTGSQVPGVLMASRGGGEQVERVRSDQLIFLTRKSTGAYRSNTPATERVLGSDVTSADARIWYGHALRTLDTGADAGDPLNGYAPYDLLGDEGGENMIGTSWILGRQALLLVDPVSPIASTQHNSTNRVWAEDPGTPGAAAYWNAEVVGYPTIPDDSSDDPGGNPYQHTQLYRGLTDVALTTPELIATYLSPPGSYPDLLLPYTFAARPSGDPSARLRVNPAPVAIDVNDNGVIDNDEWSGNAAWQIAQTHPYLASNVSDFIVEFAGDYDPIDGRIDTDDMGTPSDPEDDVTRWYTSDALANSPYTAGDYRDPDGDYKHYEPTTFPVAQPPNVSASFPGTATIGVTNEAYHLSTAAGTLPTDFEENADAIFVFRHDDAEDWSGAGAGDTTNTKWPYLIRIRYRLNDARGRLVSTDPAQVDGVDNDNPTNTNPDDIDDPNESVFRYDELDNDFDGDIANPEEARLTYSGQWFEHIIQVNRP